MASRKKRARKCRISLGQIKYSLDVRENVEKIKRGIRIAKKAGSDIICFPESCLHQSRDFKLEDKFVKEIKEECQKNQIWAIITDEFKIKERYYNSALLINRSGELKGIYKKIKTFDEDVKAGKRLGVFKTEFAKIGIVICWDLRFPELFKKMKEKGVEIVFCPTRWCYEYSVYRSKHKEKEKKLLKSLIMARAFENLFFMALVNPIIKGAYFRDLVSYSAIISPHKVLKELYNKEGILTAEINLNELKKLQKVYSKGL